MIKITPAAAAQIQVSAEQGNAEGLPLRIAVERKDDGSFHYMMGFDDQQRPGDMHLESEGVKLVVNAVSEPFANGLMLDFVDIDGNMEFIFLNPNDPSYQPPQE